MHDDRYQQYETRSGMERLAFWLLWITIASLPAEKSLEIPGFGTITKLLGVVAIAAGVLSIVAQNRIRMWNQVHVVMVLFIVWSGLTYMWTYSEDLTSARLVTYLQLFGLVVLTWELCYGEREQLRILQAYAFGVCIPAADTVFRYLLARQTYYQRYASEGFDPNDFAVTCCIGIPISYYLSLRSEGWMRWLYRLIIGATLFAIFLSASRAGTAASLVGLSLVPLTFRYLSRREQVALVVVVLVLTAVLVSLVPPTSWNRLSTAASEFSEGTLNSRTLIWKTGLDALRHSPFQGIGAGAFPIISEPIMGTRKGNRVVAHNTFLSVLTETGIVGFALFSILLGMLVFFIYRFPELERRFWSITLLAWAVGVSTLTWEQRKPTWLLFSLILVQGSRSLTANMNHFQASSVLP